MLNNKDIIKIILEHFPNSEILSIKEFEEGYNNVSYDVKLDDREIVFKLIKLGRKEKLSLKQKKIKELLNDKFGKFPIANVLSYDFSQNKYDISYIILDKINGNSWKSKSKDIDNKDKLFEKLGELYGKLHSIKFEEYGELNSDLELYDEYDNWYESKCDKIERIFRELKNNKILSDEELNLQIRYYNSNKEILKLETSPTLCHGDFSDGNIIVDIYENKKYEITGIIDFEFAKSSGAVEDLFSGFKFGMEKIKFKDSLIKGYSKFSKLPNNWEKLVEFYQWVKNIDRLNKINSMKWRNLSQDDTLKRKAIIKKRCLESLSSFHSNVVS